MGVSWLSSNSEFWQVGSCKDVNNILSRIPCEGMDDDQTHSVSRMKEIVSTIVSRRSKILGIRNRELLALVRTITLKCCSCFPFRSRNFEFHRDGSCFDFCVGRSECRDC